MPHQCVRCNKIYSNVSTEIIKGCSCGNKLFFYVKESKLEKAKEQVAKLSKEDKKRIEEDVYDIIGKDFDSTSPVILDFESVKVLQPGKFELDLVNLFNKEHPLVYKLDDGKYMVDIPSTLQKMNEEKDRKELH